MGVIYGRTGWCLAASFVLVVRQSLLSACPRLCLSVVLQGQPTRFPGQQQVSMEQQAGLQMVQGRGGRVTSVSIKLSPSATGSRCQFLLRVLPAVPAAISARCKPRLFSVCAHPWEHGGASPAGWDKLPRELQAHLSSWRWEVSTCSVWCWKALGVRSSAACAVRSAKCEIWGNSTTPSPLAVHIHCHRPVSGRPDQGCLATLLFLPGSDSCSPGQRDLLLPRWLPAPCASQGGEAAPPTPAPGGGRGCTRCLLEPSWTNLVPA